MKIIKKICAILTSLLISMGAAQAETWNMALAYGASNFHSANATEFANAVTEKTGGKLTIKTHPGGSLFKGGAILRAVQTGQTQIGERFMSAHGSFDPLLEVDSIPFVAQTYEDAQKLYNAPNGFGAACSWFKLRSNICGKVCIVYWYFRSNSWFDYFSPGYKSS